MMENMEERQEVPAEETPVEGVHEDPEVLREASDYGWVPQSEWHGNADEWVPAEQFVKRGREVNHMLNKSLTRERDKTRKLENELSALKDTVKGLADYRQKLEKTVYSQAMSDLKAQLRNARAEGDLEAAADLEGQLDDLRTQAPKDEPTPAPTRQAAYQEAVQTSVVAWAQSNSWYNKQTNPQMVRYMDGVVADLIRESRAAGIEPNPPEVLQQAAVEVKRMFPQKFAAPSMFDGGGRSGAPSRGGGYASLPPDAKREFERFYASGYYGKVKKEEAAAEYFKVYNEG